MAPVTYTLLAKLFLNGVAILVTIKHMMNCIAVTRKITVEGVQGNSSSSKEVIGTQDVN
jgi:hypothetical protein